MEELIMPKEQKAAPASQEQDQAQAPATARQMPPMELDVRIRPVNKGNLMAYASMNINGAFAVDGLKVVSGEKGLFVSMPSYKDSQGKFREVCFPVSKAFRDQINQAVLGQYQQTLEQMRDAVQQQNRQQEQPAPEMSAPAMGM